MPVIARLPDHRVELLLVQRVEAAGRLVQNENSWPVHEGLDEHDLALVARRVLAELAARVEVKAIDELLEVGMVDAASKVREVLEDLAAGQVGVERRLARHVADEPFDVDRSLPAVEACDARAARVRAQQRHEDADGRRLAGAVGPQEAEHLALADLQREVDDASLAAIAFGQALDLDHCFRHLVCLLRLQRSMIPLLSRSQNSWTSTISFIRRFALPGASCACARCIAWSES